MRIMTEKYEDITTALVFSVYRKSHKREFCRMDLVLLRIMFTSCILYDLFGHITVKPDRTFFGRIKLKLIKFRF